MPGHKTLDKLVSCFHKGQHKKIKQWEVKMTENKTVILSLWKNQIARKFNNGKIRISLCGWNTSTSRRGINAILPHGISIFTRKGNAIVSFKDTKKDYRTIKEIGISSYGIYELDNYKNPNELIEIERE